VLSKNFLLQECANVKLLLDKTLKHEYAPEDSERFYEECLIRLSYLQQELNNSRIGIASTARDLNILAELICRIERSSIGEYSWPFLHELKRITEAICKENKLLEDDQPPSVFVFADGGLASYAIYPEKNRPSYCRLRLLTIVVPKAHKDFALLHPVLGHELGHAIWQTSKHQGYLRDNVVQPIKQNSAILSSVKSVLEWFGHVNAPASFKPLNSSNVRIDLDAWFEEILCDLIGLVIFGPTFVAALSRLLLTIDPTGESFSEKHPPVAWRLNMMISGAHYLGYMSQASGSSSVNPALQTFWTYINSFKRDGDGSWNDVIPGNVLSDALKKIKSLFEQHAPTLYPEINPEQLSHLLANLASLTPPVGHSFLEGMPKNIAVDFRHIVYAGWITTTTKPEIPFELVNRLCEHAIMQQRAINMTLSD
jgi:hypothetical protein